MYKEPWSDIKEYPESHRAALEAELKAEVGGDHILANQNVSVLAKRQDQDDVLVVGGGHLYIVHLTWSGHAEPAPYPKTEWFASRAHLDGYLSRDVQ